MLIKTLPGLGIALALGLFFCFSESGGNRPGGNSDGAKRGSPAVREPGVSVFRTRAPSASAPKAEYGPVLDNDLFAMAPAFVPPIGAADFTLSGAVEPAAGAEAMDPGGLRGAGKGLASQSAFASLSNAVAREAEPAPFLPTSAYPDLPAKGLAVWGNVETFKEKQKMRDHGRGIYKRDGGVYTVGVKQDWSIDSVIGMSLDIHDSTMKSRHVFNDCDTDITGYVGNANYYGTFLGRYPVEAKAFYGRFRHESSGTLRDHQMEAPWIEKKHDSSLYGFSAKAGIPLLFMDNLKVLPEIGVTWQRLVTKKYRVGLSPDGSVAAAIPEIRSTSLSIPLSLTMKKDFPQMWGVVSPRFNCGATYELDDSAAGVQVMNSSAGAGLYWSHTAPDAVTMLFDPAQKVTTHIGVGVDVKTVGGWELSADFERSWAKKYNKDAFRLELGRCF